LIGQWWAHQLGLGYVLPEAHVKKALASIFANNWLPDFTGFEHNWRKFAGGKDKGLLICTWPKGGRPANTIPYVDEVWTGVEYQVAAHMIYEGMVEEGFAIIKGLRDRYDGAPRAPIPRNPWNEIECGGHYARAMSSWSVLLALSGWEQDSPAGRLTIAPRYQADDFKSIFAASEGWGSLSQTRKGGTQKNAITVAEGELKIAHLRLKAASAPKKAKVALGGKEAKATMKTAGGFVEIAFSEPVTIRKGESLQVTLS
jgi:hypothetical protein